MLIDAGTSSAFSKNVYFQSNLRVIDPRSVTVSRRNGTLYAFDLTLHVLLQETVELTTEWTVKSRATGNYTVGLSAFSDDPDVDPLFRSCEDSCGIQISEDVPTLGQPILSPVYYSQGLDPKEMYTYPEQDIELQCNVSCPFGIRNVTLYYLVDSNTTWNQLSMTRNSGNLWIAIVPGQPEGTLVKVYVEAFSMSGKSSRTREYACRISDLQLLEFRSRIMAGTTVTAILIGVIGIFALKKRKVNKEL